MKNRTTVHKSWIATGAFKTVSLVALSLVAVAVFLPFFYRVEAASKFWIASGPGNFNDDANWSLTSGGPANTTAPGPSDSARFDGNGLGNCTISSNVTLQSMVIGSAYTGEITVATGVDLTFGPFSFFQMDGGIFNASNGTLLVNAGEGLGSFIQTGGVFNGNGTIDLNVANVTLSGGIFNATPGNLTFHRSLTRTNDFRHNNGTVISTAQPGGGMSVPGPTPKPFNNLILNNSGAFTVSGATVAVEGALGLNGGTVSSGTFDAQGAVSFGPAFGGGSGNLLISGAAMRTVTFAAGTNLLNITLNAPNVTVETSGSGTLNGQALTLQAGTINQGTVNFVLSGSYSQSGGTFNSSSGNFSVNPGLFGTFVQSGGVFNGNGTIDFNVSNATFSGGTFNATPGNTTFHRGFTRTTGTFNPNNGTVIFTTEPGTGISLSSPSTQTFNNLTLNNSGDNFNLTGTAEVLGTLTLQSGLVNGGTFQARGNVVVQSTFGFGNPLTGGTTSITFNGTGNQIFTNNGGANPSGTWTINKPSGSVTLASNLILGTTQALNLTAGTLDLGPSFNLTCGALTVGASGVLRDFGTGNITLGGNLNNSGLVNLNGGGSGCSDPNLADLLLIQSTDTNARTWSGNGAFSLVDVEIDRQTVGATPGSITAFGSSHLSNATGFVLDSGCPVSITTHPTNQGGCAGGPVSFTVGASGTGLTLQWRKNSNNLNNGGNISGATSITLTINPTAAGDVGSYDAVATSTLGITATSNAATLSLLAPPQITQSPSDASRCEGQPVTFTVAASGDGLSFQWRKNLNPIGGAPNSNSFTIPTVATTDAGSYDVVVSGTCTPPAISAAAALIVNSAPNITQQPTNQTACETGTASFNVAATGSALTFQWRKNMLPLTNNGHFAGVDTATLNINSVVPGDADNYDVVVTGSCDPAVTSLPRSLTVNTGTNISQQPADNTVCAGATASFTAGSNDGTATVKWQVSTDGGSNFNDVGGATSTTLSFTASANQNGHKFRAVFNGVCTGATTNAATLTVNSAPAITNQPSNQTVCDGGSATFSVNTPDVSASRKGKLIRLQAAPGLTFQWRRNGNPLSNGGNIQGADTMTLTINPATAADVANYDVVVSGSCSPPATSNPASLTVDGFALSANSQDFGLAGGNGSVNLLTAGTCNWTAVSNDSFIHINSGSSGTGNGTVNFSVDAAAASRSGTMTIASKTFTVNQSNMTVAAVIISEFRLRGSAGALDEFIELYNDSDSEADISGYTLQALDAGGAATLVFTVPGSGGSNTTVLPARGHYLIANNSMGGYSLGSVAVPNGTYTADIVDGSGLGLFAGSIPATDNRADSVGFDNRNPLFFETSVLTPAGGINTDGEFSLLRQFVTTNGQPQDSNNNATDFLFIATSGGVFNGRQSMLGAPGPENLASPITRNSAIPATLIDQMVTAATAPNRVRDLTPDAANNSTFGTLTIRRRFTNNTGQNVTQLRFRIMNFTTFPAPGPGVADLRARSSSNTTVTITGGSMLNVMGTTLDAPTQALGGGYNSTLSVGVITLANPLAPGVSVNLQFLLGVQTTGQFRFFVNVEALTAPLPPP